MAKKFETLRGRMSAAAREASDAEYRRLVREMSLLELRKARELTQTEVAEQLHIGQGDVSKLEHRADMYVSTLANYLRAVGAGLEIQAVFPNGEKIKITFSGDLDDEGVAAPKAMRAAGSRRHEG